MESSVKAQRFRVAAPRQLEVASDTLLLTALGGREVACETLYSAVSPGTELALFDGLPPARAERTHSRAIGYCNLSRVIAAGDWVSSLEPGDLVLTSQPHCSHFACGADEILLRLPRREYTQEQLAAASTTYLFHQGYNALLRGELQPGQYVGVVGLGVLGLATVAVARHFGARVFAFSDLPSRRALAEELGAVATFDKQHLRECSAAVREATARTGLDILVLTGNGWNDLRFTLELAPPGGKVCVLGFPGRRDPQPPFNPFEPALFYRKQLSLIACGYTPDVQIAARDLRFTVPRNAAFLLELVLAGELPASRLVSAVVPWRQLGDVYGRLAQRDESLLTAVLKWQEGDGA